MNPANKGLNCIDEWNESHRAVLERGETSSRVTANVAGTRNEETGTRRP
jgi:hypothetical protein